MQNAELRVEGSSQFYILHSQFCILLAATAAAFTPVRAGASAPTRTTFPGRPGAIRGCAHLTESAHLGILLPLRLKKCYSDHQPLLNSRKDELPCSKKPCPRS